MKLRNCKYYFKEATKSVFKSDWMSLASIFSVVASLLVFGIFMVLSVNLNYIATQLEGDYEIILVVDENYTDEQTDAIKSIIEGTENVEKAELDRKEDRLNEMRSEFGENAFLLDGYEEDNPLRDWYKVRLVDLSKSEETANDLETIPGIVKIIRNQDTIDKLVSMTSYMDKISLWIMVALALISVFIISNTIKLTVNNRRKEINIMKYIGATDYFVRAPFVVEGLLIGLIGSTIPLCLIYLLYNYIIEFILSNFAVLNNLLTFLPVVTIMNYLVPISLGIGAGIGFLGSFTTVRKHLRV